MTDPQIYLITPPDADASTFPARLAACLDTVPVACVRLSIASEDPARITRAADALRETCHARDVALVIDTHLRLVEKLGLDGVHLRDGARSVGAARKALGQEAIVGAHCGTSRHEGMSAGERGADYAAFGPLSDDGLGSGAVAEPALFEWWSQMIELPVVAEGGLTGAVLRAIAPHTDFAALGPEIWGADDPAAHLRALHNILTGKG